MTDGTMTEIPLVEQLECAAYGSEDGAIIREAAAMLKAAVEALDEAQYAMTCGHDDGACYCPNCDNSFHEARGKVRNTLASLKQPGGR